MKPGAHFPKACRLLGPADFSPIFDTPSIKVHHAAFLLLARANDLSHPRLGIVVGKKNVRLAAQRNRLKRLIRESFRNKRAHLPAIDAIVLARRGSELLDNHSIVEIVDGLWNRAAKKARKVMTQDQATS